MGEALLERFCTLVDEGRCETVEGRPFLPLLVLESEMRYGLALVDEALQWARAQEGPSGPVLIFARGAEIRFVELVEHERDELEDRIGSAAGAVGLDPSQTVASLPAVAIVAGLLADRTALFCRQALRWARPTELRALRDAIQGVADDRSLPQDVRSLAARLVVPT